MPTIPNARRIAALAIVGATLLLAAPGVRCNESDAGRDLAAKVKKQPGRIVGYYTNWSQ
jgi:hypothetical protein